MISMIIHIYAMALEDSFELDDAASRREKYGKKNGTCTKSSLYF